VNNTLLGTCKVCETGWDTELQQSGHAHFAVLPILQEHKHLAALVAQDRVQSTVHSLGHNLPCA